MDETKAMLAGVQFMMELGLPKVMFESESLLVIQALKSSLKGSSDFHLIIDDIISLTSSFDAFV